MNDVPNPDKKIIVDEDWKGRVEAERRQKAERETQPPESHLPPAGMPYIVSIVYLQAAIALGIMPNPITGGPQVRLGTARHVIDTLAILQEKTEGRRTPEESEQIEAVLHQLRMAFVEVSSHGPQASDSPEAT